MTRGDSDRLFGNLGNDTFDFSDYNAATIAGPRTRIPIASWTSPRASTKFRANIVNDGDPEYTEVAAAGVTSVEEAIEFADMNNLFDSTGRVPNDFVFIAGATHGYLIVNVNGNTGIFDARHRLCCRDPEREHSRRFWIRRHHQHV